MKIGLLVAVTALLLAGCAAAPCHYKGKAISRRDAQNMKNLGMDVQCPGEPLK